MVKEQNVIELKRREPAARLAIARTLIASVRDEQNTRYRLCGECGLRHYEDLDGRKAANKLEGVLTTLDNILRELGT